MTNRNCRISGSAQNPWPATRSSSAEKDFEKAREVLQNADALEHVLQGGIAVSTAKVQGLPEIEYPQFTRKFA